MGGVVGVFKSGSSLVFGLHSPYFDFAVDLALTSSKHCFVGLMRGFSNMLDLALSTGVSSTVVVLKVVRIRLRRDQEISQVSPSKNYAF